MQRAAHPHSLWGAHTKTRNTADPQMRPALSGLKAFGSTLASTNVAAKVDWTRVTLYVSCVTLR